MWLRQRIFVAMVVLFALVGYNPAPQNSCRIAFAYLFAIKTPGRMESLKTNPQTASSLWRRTQLLLIKTGHVRDNFRDNYFPSG